VGVLVSHRGDLRILDDHPLFAAESRRWRRLFAAHAERVRLPVGAELMREGSQPRQVTLIRTGRAAVTRWGDPLGEVGPGSTVGASELGRLTVSDVTVTATTPVDAIVLHRQAFRGAWRALAGLRARVQSGARRSAPVP
jgi:CRP-like cAMP-binding protein